MADLEEFDLTEEEKQLLAQYQKGVPVDVSETEPSSEAPEQPTEETTTEQQTEQPEQQEPEQEQKSEQKMVPLKALQEEREERRFLKQELERYKQAVERMKEDFLALREQLQKQPEQPQIEIPSPDEDPLGYAQAKIQEHEQIIENFRKFQEQISQQSQMQQQINELAMRVNNAEIEFARQHPDYWQAVEFLRQKRIQELRTLGIDDERAIMTDLQAQAFQISTTALQRGKNPAEVLYELAKMNGYTPQNQQTQQTQQQTQQDDTLKKVQQGQQQASQTLKGGSTTVEPTLQALLEAEGEEFDRLWDEYFKKHIRR